MILFIDTTDYTSVTYSMVGKAFLSRSFASDSHKSHQILKNLESFLKKHVNAQDKIQKIIACKGPGSYTGTRIGVTHTLALGFAWNVPVKFLEKGKFDAELQKQIKKLETASR